YKSQKDEVITTQYPMKDVEKIGLVKFDFLGLKTLTVIDKTVKLVRANRGDAIDMDGLSLDDPATYRLLATGNTNGVFQLESSGLKDLLRKLKLETFEELVAAVALYRPGPLQSGMVDDFINRKHGKVPMKYELPELKDILENTYGVMVYQEQVMEIAKVLAGYTPGDADVLRKAMGKKIPEEMLSQRQKFLDGSKKKNIPQKKAEKIFDLMAKFAGYGFNKSHSAAYALIAYQTAYLKEHYTVEFTAALLSADMGNTDQVVKYINECKDMGLAVEPPDINKSFMEFTVNGGKIRFGLAAVKNAGSSAIDEILAVRKDGPFTSMLDFLSRVDSRKVNKKVVESLIKCGAFDSTGVTRAHLLNTLDASMEAAQGLQRDRDAGQGSIFDMLGSPAAAASGAGNSAEPQATELNEKDLLNYEKETLGFYFSSHPLSRHKKELELYTGGGIETLKDRDDGGEVAIGGIVTEVKEITTKKGGRMAFLRVEDLNASVEVTVFPDLYRKVREALSSDLPLIISGRLEKDEDGVKIMASEIALIEDASGMEKKLKVKNTHVYAKTDGFEPSRLAGFRKILEENPGASPVFLHLLYPDDGEVVIGVREDLKADPSQETIEKIRTLLNGADVRLI
ncbi:MAG: DNA polymerase III subunit alpha, partial [Deltaproteobacteria bacterium]